MYVMEASSMKIRRVLRALLAVIVLMAAFAIPAAAEGDVGMWMSQVKIAYNGRSSHSADRMVGQVHVRDTDLDFVTDATVTAVWTTPKGATITQTAVTAFQGIAWFEVWAGAGTYTLCVTAVEKDGWVYQRELNTESCATFMMPVPMR